MQAVPARTDDARSTTLWWVRHGEAVSNRDGQFGGHGDAPLTALGRAQAEATARAMAARRPTAIVASDLPRARQTAAPIAEATGLPLVFDRRLRERSLGILDGMSFVEAQQRYPALWERLRSRDHAEVPEGGEPVDAVFARVAAAIDDVAAAHPGGRVVVVSHGLALYHAFCHVCGLGSPGAGHPVFVLVDNCSLSTVERRLGEDGAHRWRLRGLNDTSHLAGLRPDDGEAPPA
jgi:probable phosphoglycerate mutase